CRQYSLWGDSVDKDQLHDPQCQACGLSGTWSGNDEEWLSRGCFQRRPLVGVWRPTECRRVNPIKVVKGDHQFASKELVVFRTSLRETANSTEVFVEQHFVSALDVGGD